MEGRSGVLSLVGPEQYSNPRRSPRLRKQLAGQVHGQLRAVRPGSSRPIARLRNDRPDHPISRATTPDQAQATPNRPPQPRALAPANATPTPHRPELLPHHRAQTRHRDRSSLHPLPILICCLPLPRLGPTPSCLDCPDRFTWRVEEGPSGATRRTALPPKSRHSATDSPPAGQRPIRLQRRTQETNT